MLAAIAQVQGRREDSDAIQGEAITLASESGDDWTLAFVLTAQAAMMSIRGETLAAQPLHKEALALARRCGALRLIAIECCNLAEILLGLDEFGPAEALIDEALEQAGKIGYHSLIAGAQATRAVLLLNRGEIDAAAEQVSSAIAPTAAADDHETAPVLLSAAAVIAAARAQPLRAATLWAAADQMLSWLVRDEPAMTATLRSQWLPLARAAVPDADRWDEAWVTGAQLPVAEALMFAAGAVAARVTGRSGHTDIPAPSLG
jgi:tetratricopeptide (TPR) repeat protein